MRFLHGRVKANKGGKIRVKVSMRTRVLIMNDRNFKRYKNNMSFTYYGGHKEGEYEFQVPSTNFWNVVVEKGSYANPIDIKVNIEVEKGAVHKPAKPKKLATSFEEADEQMDGVEEEVAGDASEDDEDI